MKKKFVVFGAALVFTLSLLAAVRPVHASFNASNIMSDSVFNNSGSMSAVDIQNFLNQFPTSCLRNYSAPYPNDYFSYGGNVSAATVIRRVADLWGINPQVILATLQKESSVVTGTASYGCAYMNTAMGFNCPDSGACPVDPANSGFSQQVTKGGWLLKAAEERSLGHIDWDPPLDPDNDRNYYYAGPMTQGYRQRRYDAPVQYFDGLYTIDNQTVSMASGATASFYWYTPHFSGNQNLVNIFEGWFGSTQTTIPYLWAYESQAAFSDAGYTQAFTSTPTVTPGGTLYMRVKARNVGTQTWSPSIVHLGTSNPKDRASPFKNNTWLNAARVPQMNESSVHFGEVATFEFTMTAPSTPGTYVEYFNLVADGVTWFNDPGLYYVINVVNPASPSNTTNTSLGVNESIHARQYLMSPDAESVLALQPDGNLALFSNFKPVWGTNTQGTGASLLVMQGDGNLVLYNGNGQAQWNSQTNGHPGAHLVLQTDGNLVIYSQAGTPLWSTGTVHNPNHLSYVNYFMPPVGKLYPGQSIDTANRQFKMVLQNDGNLVIYSPNRAIWASGTVGKAAAYLTIQGDGNLVLYDINDRPLWHTSTIGYGPSLLAMQTDGNLVIYTGAGRPTWASATAGKL